MAVPNTNTFSLNDVRLELGLLSNTNLVSCFSVADPAQFDPLYAGAKNQLDDFRNYGAETRVSISLGNGVSALSACTDFIGSPSSYYRNGTSFLNATELYTNITGTIQPASGWYSDGTDARNWTGTSFTGTSEPCIV